jgi:hypothetical protein
MAICGFSGFIAGMNTYIVAFITLPNPRLLMALGCLAALGGFVLMIEKIHGRPL